MPKKCISIAIFSFEMRTFMWFMKHFHSHHHLCLWSRKMLIFFLPRNFVSKYFHARWIHKVNKEIIRMRVLMKNDAFDCRCMNEFLRVYFNSTFGNVPHSFFFHSIIKYSIYGFHHVHYECFTIWSFSLIFIWQFQRHKCAKYRYFHSKKIFPSCMSMCDV